MADEYDDDQGGAATAFDENDLSDEDRSDYVSGIERGDKVGGAGNGGSEFAQALKVMADFGLHLPPGTTPQNVWERVNLIGHQKQQSGKGAEETEDRDVAEAQDTQQPVMMSTDDEDDYREGLRRGDRLLGRRQRSQETADEKKDLDARAAKLTPRRFGR